MKREMSGMIKRIKINWLDIALATVVIISLILSGIIWTNPFQYDHPRDTSNSGTQNNSTQSIGDLYLPTQVVKNGSGQEQKILYSSRVNLVRQVQRQMKHWQLGRSVLVKNNNSDVYLSYLRQPNSLMLSYSDPVPATIFNETFAQTIDTSRIKQVDYILIPLHHPHNIYLLSDHGYRVYRVRIGRGSNDKYLKPFMDNSRTINQVAVEHKIINGKTLLLYPHSFSLPVFGYQVTAQNADTLSQNLISSNKRSTVNTNHNGHITTYRDGEDKRVFYDHWTGKIYYRNLLSKQDVPESSALYSYFYRLIARTGIPLNNLRYDGINNRQRMISYRSYVEGFPIYNHDGYGAIKVKAANSGKLQLWMTLYNIEVPVPINQQTEKLPSTTTVFNELRQNNKLKDISDIRVGYLWHSDSTNKVARLTPTYFVKSHGSWVNYHKLEK